MKIHPGGRLAISTEGNGASQRSSAWKNAESRGCCTQVGSGRHQRGTAFKLEEQEAAIW